MTTVKSVLCIVSLLGLCCHAQDGARSDIGLVVRGPDRPLFRGETFKLTMSFVNTIKEDVRVLNVEKLPDPEDISVQVIDEKQQSVEPQARPEKLPEPKKEDFDLVEVGETWKRTLDVSRLRLALMSAGKYTIKVRLKAQGRQGILLEGTADILVKDQDRQKVLMREREVSLDSAARTKMKLRVMKLELDGKFYIAYEQYFTDDSRALRIIDQVEKDAQFVMGVQSPQLGTYVVHVAFEKNDRLVWITMDDNGNIKAEHEY